MTTLENLENPPTLFGAQPDDVVLIAHAHPDDEMMTAGAAKYLHEIGIPVVSYIATYGEASNRGDPALLAGGLRRIEAAGAAARLGILPELQIHDNLGDGQLPRAIGALTLRISGLVADYNIKHIITAGEHGYDGHQDHIAVHEAVKTVKSQEAYFGEPLHVWGLTRQIGTYTLPPNSALRMDVLANHRSQFELIKLEPGKPIPAGWVKLDDYALSPETRKLLATYLPLFKLRESYKPTLPNNTKARAA